jgi:hypothetical protein
MRILLLVTALLLISKTGFTQDPEQFEYQAIVRNASGEAVVSRDVSYRFSILTGNVSGISVYSEIHNVTTDKSGLIDLTIGNGMNKTGNLSAIKWDSEKLFLKVESDITGGSDYIDIGTTQMIVIPLNPEAGESKKSSLIIPEDELFIIRKYLGKFIAFRHTGPDTYDGPNLIWIKTSLDNIYGKISAYGKSCEFSVGENLYLKRAYYSPGGISGYWIYQIENDSKTYYRVTDFQNDKKIFVENLFK